MRGNFLVVSILTTNQKCTVYPYFFRVEKMFLNPPPTASRLQMHHEATDSSWRNARNQRWVIPTPESDSESEPAPNFTNVESESESESTFFSQLESESESDSE